MKTIEEYCLNLGENVIRFPEKSQFLAIFSNFEKLMLAVKVNSKYKMVKKKLFVIPAYKELPNNIRYIGSAVIKGCTHYVFEQSKNIKV